MQMWETGKKRLTKNEYNKNIEEKGVSIAWMWMISAKKKHFISGYTYKCHLKATQMRRDGEKTSLNYVTTWQCANLKCFLSVSSMNKFAVSICVYN